MFRIRIRQLREESGYRSQQAFANAFGVAQTTVASWEGGKREPGYATTIRLADFFHVSIDYLLGHDVAHETKKEAPVRDGDLLKLEQIYNNLPPDRCKELLRFAEYQFSQSSTEAPRKEA